jgi:transcriptional regulator GlxA family with amidase domain
MADRVVLIACFPRVQPLDVVGPHEVFAGATRLLESVGSDAPRYRVHIVAGTPGPVTSESGLTLHAGRALPRTGAIDTLLVPGGDGALTVRHDARYMAWLRRAVTRSRRVGSVCSGAFVLAEAGLLDGCRVTTHWHRAEQLRREYPALAVDADPIFTRTGDIWTSAGVTAGIDLALAMVEEDHGAELAQTIARHLVMFLRRPGGQSQFATALWSGPAARDAIRDAQQRVHADPAADHRVDALADAVSMSPRHFTRVFQSQIGESPARYVERVRVERARTLLEQEPLGVAAVAVRSGFGTAETMRRAFLRRVGVAPDDYRKRFR